MFSLFGCEAPENARNLQVINVLNQENYKGIALLYKGNPLFLQHN